MNETGWLIEVFGDDKVSTGMAVGVVTTRYMAVSYDNAIRFARKKDAETLISVLTGEFLQTVLEAVEHTWMDEPPTRSVLPRETDPMEQEAGNMETKPDTDLRKRLDEALKAGADAHRRADERVANQIGKWSSLLQQLMELKRRVLNLNCYRPNGRNQACGECPICKLQEEIKKEAK